MNDRRRPSGRRDRKSGDVGVGAANGGKDRGRKSKGAKESNHDHEVAIAEDTPRRRRRPQQQQDPALPQRTHAKADSNDKSSSSGNKRRSKKVSDALDNIKAYKPPSLVGTARAKSKKFSSSSSTIAVNPSIISPYSNNNNHGSTRSFQAAPTPRKKAGAGSYISSAVTNPNSRQRPRAGATPRSSRRNNSNSIDANVNNPPNDSARRLARTTPSSSATPVVSKSLSQKSSCTSKSKKQQLLGKTKLANNNNNHNNADHHLIPPCLQNDLQTRRRDALDVTCVYNEDGSVEIGGIGIGSADPTRVYKCQFSPSTSTLKSIIDASSSSNDDDDNDNSADEESIDTKKKEREGKGLGGGSALGKNGWHRALATLSKNNYNNAAATTPTKKQRNNNSVMSISTKSTTPPQLDQLTVTHLLEKAHPQIDELDAIQQEYNYLLKEMNSLEKDRVQLEQQFHEAGRVTIVSPPKDKNMKESGGVQQNGSSSNNNSNSCSSMSYQEFRTNLRYMKSEDIQTSPIMWLEDIPLSPPPAESNAKQQQQKMSKKKESKLYAKLDTHFQQLIRNHRGVGVALLIADPQCKTSLIGRCYMNSNYGIVHHNMSRESMLKREQAATLIDEGGLCLRHVAITGFDKACSTPKGSDGVDGFSRSRDVGELMEKSYHGSEDVDVHSKGTTYFSKFDSGKTHHRGDLPANLVARLVREKKDATSIKYLSTGCSYAAGGGQRCYYAEFDNGECWWGTNKDGQLDQIFMEMDVHRVAFGSSSGSSPDKACWVVIGKDGSVKWRNVPQGLHDALIFHDAGMSATTTIVGGDNGIAAPCEVSLGIAGTYFIRFLDGKVDYSLPNFVANVFDKFESDKKMIRNVALHPDTYDCVIRYSIEDESRK